MKEIDPPLSFPYHPFPQILAEKILDNGGLLVSEYAINSRPFKSAFVQRNRIQSGLSLATCRFYKIIKEYETTF